MKKIFVLAILCLSLATFAQNVPFKSPYNVNSDTVTNTGTAYLTIAAPRGYEHTVVIITITKISGTVAGTITLQGSLNGTDFYNLTDTSIIPNIPTKTATDVTSQSFMWQLNNVSNHLRISWTGSGTMSALFTGKLDQFN